MDKYIRIKGAKIKYKIWNNNKYKNKLINSDLIISGVIMRWVIRYVNYSVDINHYYYYL
jgi:hypothetical protein